MTQAIAESKKKIAPKRKASPNKKINSNIERHPLTYNPIIEYFNKIESGELVASVKVKRLYKKLVADIHDECSVWEYDPQKANHAIEFVENYCKHSKGKMGGKPFILELWQKAATAAIFGFVHKIDNVRKYKEVILIVARKNGKSTWASALSLYLLFADGESGPEVVSVATKKDQAKIIWLEAKKMIKKSKSLNKRAKCLVGEITTEYNDGVFKPLSSDSNTLDGLNPSGITIDELHAILDINLYDVIVDGTSAREQPLTIITSTAGTVREGIYDIKYQEGERIINGYDDGLYTDERVLPIFYELDSRKDWTEEEAWPKANPGLGTIKNFDELKRKVEKAKANPLLVKNLLTKDFNIPENSGETWLTYDQIVNNLKIDIKELKPRYAIGGADLSSTTDLTCATVIFMVPGDERIYVLQMYFIPEELLEKRVKEDRVPYDVWKEMGWIKTCEGNKISYKDVTKWFIELQEELDIYIPWTGYDNWSATYWVEEMKAYFGKDSMEAVIQGKKTLSAPMKELGADFDSKKIIYNDNPILKWCLRNTSVDVDKNNNIQPIKGKTSTKRIDGLASLLNAYVVLLRHYEEYKSMI